MNKELLEILERAQLSGETIVIDTSQCGTQIKVKFYVIKNIDGYCYAKIKVISPKKIIYNNKVIDLTKLDIYSEKETGIFTGQEQTRKDSLYVKNGEQKIWNKGHIGYFTLFNTLLSEQHADIRNLLDVDEEWDGEWEESDVLE